MRMVLCESLAKALLGNNRDREPKRERDVFQTNIREVVFHINIRVEIYIIFQRKLNLDPRDLSEFLVRIDG